MLGPLDTLAAECYTVSMNIAQQIHATTDFTVYLNEAKAVAQLTFEQLGMPELIDKVDFELNNRIVRRAADASVRIYYNGKRGRIRLGTKYLALAGEEDRVQTFIHEAVHIVDGFANPDTWNLRGGHNRSWYELMRKAGVTNPSPCHTVDMSAFRPTYRHLCACGKIVTLTAHKAGLIRNHTRGYLCPKCRSRIEYRNLVKAN